LSKLVIKPIDWSWKNRISYRDLLILVGEPKAGKSKFVAYIATVVTQGWDWCDGNPCEKGSVLYFASEDRPEELARSLKANGADLTKIRVFDGAILEASNEQNEIDISRIRLDVLEAAIKQTEHETGEPCLFVVFDPITDFLEGDTNRPAVVRKALKPIQLFFRERRIAPILIHHNRKSKDGNAMSRISGAGSFSQVARNLWRMQFDPNDTAKRQSDRLRYFVHIDSNICVNPAGVSFKIVEDGRIDIIDSVVQKTADDFDVIEQRQDKKRGRPSDVLDEVKAWLRQYLADGAKSATAVARAAEEQGFSDRTLQDAKKALGINSQRRGGRDGQFWWRLPDCPENDE
jgi:hypothetical protein